MCTRHLMYDDADCYDTPENFPILSLNSSWGQISLTVGWNGLCLLLGLLERPFP